jgi:hypothetical protein
MIPCPGRGEGCPDWCFYEHERIWCPCYDAPNIHMWWQLQGIVITDQRCDELNDVGGCMIQGDCNRPPESRENLLCLIPLKPIKVKR